ncbi:MAG: peroxiredoxin-like family protein, partial [Candidatus Hydrogenedentota bacterium]
MKGLKLLAISALGVAMLFGYVAFVNTEITNAEVEPAETAEEVRPPLVGTELPDLTVTTVEGETVHLKDELEDQPAVLVVYRGGWCMYCNMQLGQLATIEGDLQDLGYDIIAVSPDKPEELEASAEEHDLGYTLYSDSSLEAANALGLVFQVDEGTLDTYQEHGIDLAEASGGANEDLLPVPAVFVIDSDATIQFHYVNPDYTARIAPELL